MRLPSASPASSGIDQRARPSRRGDGGEQHGHEPRVVELGDQEIESCCTAQKSKLIIFFITKMPIDIQITQPTSISWPVGCGPQQRDVVGAREVDEQHDDRAAASR